MGRFNPLFCFALWSTSVYLQYVACGEFENNVKECLNLKHRTGVELPLEVIDDKGALELWFYYGGKYDLYLTYNNGHIYHNELRLSEMVTPRTSADRANCSNYLLPKPNWYDCPFTITENDHQVNITLESFAPTSIYSIDKTSNEVAYVRDTNGIFGSGTEQSQTDCANQISKYNIPLPMEVFRKQNHLEVAVKYQEKYDFYNTIDLGTICGIQYQLDEKPNPTVEEYAHCSKCGTFSSYFWCPYKINEDENDIIISLEAFFYNNVYRINKLTEEVRYEKSLIGIDPHKSFEEEINKCQNNLSDKNVLIPVQIIRNDNFLEIWVKNNDKFDIFETGVSGSICKHDLQSSREPNILVPRHPAECFSPGLDVPYYFICPYDILEDEDYVFFKIHAQDQYLYAFKKSTDEIVYRTFPTIYDSDHQGAVTYLRSIVADPNFF